MTYHARFSSYSGMTYPLDVEDHERATVRRAAAEFLRESRYYGLHVVTLTRGEQWECRERGDARMVDDACGFLVLRHTTHECRECGSGYETRVDAALCCEDFS